MRSILVAFTTALAVLSHSVFAVPVGQANSLAFLPTSATSPLSVQDSFAGVTFTQPKKAVTKRQKVKVPRWKQSEDPSAMFSRQQLEAKPKRRRNALAPRASSVVGLSGTIQVSQTDGTVLGYVSTVGLTNSNFVYDPDVVNAVTVTVPASGTTGNIVLPSTATYPYFGICNIEEDDDTDFYAYSENYGILTASQSVPSGSTAMNVDNNFGSRNPVETSVWTYEALTEGLTATWINPDSTSSTISFVSSTYNNDNTLYPTGDPSSLIDQTGPDYFVVTFTFIPV